MYLQDYNNYVHALDFISCVQSLVHRMLVEVMNGLEKRLLLSTCAIIAAVKF